MADHLRGIFVWGERQDVGEGVRSVCAERKPVAEGQRRSRKKVRSVRGSN